MAAQLLNCFGDDDATKKMRYETKKLYCRVSKKSSIELQLRIHTELCKATVENTKLVAKHLKINEEELKDKTKVSIINKIVNVVEKELTGAEEVEEEEILVDTPPPL